jgi:hypothetical protein
MEIEDIETLVTTHSRLALSAQQDIQQYKESVKATVLASYMQSVRLDYMLFKSEIYQIIFHFQVDAATALIDQVQSQRYPWTLHRYSHLLKDHPLAEDLFLLHNVIVDYALNGLKACIHQEVSYAQAQFDAMQEATIRLAKLVKASF